MCLYVQGRQRIPAAPRSVFKVYQIDKTEKLDNFLDQEDRLVVRPPCMGGRVLISQGNFILSNRRVRKITSDEKKYKQVANGIHAYLKKQDALDHISNRSDGFIVVECLGHSEDFVAQCPATWGEKARCVYHKLEPIKIIASKEEGFDTKTELH